MPGIDQERAALLLVVELLDAEGEHDHDDFESFIIYIAPVASSDALVARVAAAAAAGAAPAHGPQFDIGNSTPLTPPPPRGSLPTPTHLAGRSVGWPKARRSPTVAAKRV